MQLKYHRDPGHGWLEVPLYVAIKVKTPLKRISPYSYVGMSQRDGVTLYLEEDCDMPIFMDAAKQMGASVTTLHVNYDHDCFVRGLNRFPTWHEGEA